MKKISYYFLPVFWAAILTLGACSGGGKKPEPWVPKSIPVLNEQLFKGDKVNLQVFVDATSSMKGFSAFPKSGFEQLLSELDDLPGKLWTQSTISYFRFGEMIIPSDRAGFRDAFLKPEKFFQGVGTKTLLEKVVRNANDSSLTLVITDLFQTENDLVPVMDSIKMICFNRNIYMGIMPVKSQFKGMIYDTGLSDFYFNSGETDPEKFRTMYLLMFGSQNRIYSVYKQLTTTSLITKDEFLLISPVVFAESSVGTDQDKQVFTKLKSDKEREIENTFRLNKKVDEGVIDVRFLFSKRPFLPQIDLTNLDMKVEEKYPPGSMKEGSEELLKSEIIISRPDTSQQQYRTSITIKPGKKAGWYSYHFYLDMPVLQDISVPGWVMNVSAERVTQAENPNKTLNLDKFIKGLLIRCLNNEEITVAQTFITIERK